MQLLEFLTSAATGGVLGGILSGFKLYAGYKKQQIDYAFQIDLAKETRLNIGAEMELAKMRGEIDLEIQESTDDSANLRAAMEAESQITNTSQWVNDLRGSTRPILTYALTLAAAIIQTTDFVFMATTAITFWFGDRPPKKS